MTAAEVIRLLCIAFAVPNAGLCLGLAIHLWQRGRDPVYRAVFRSAVWAYAGFSLLLLGLAWRHYSLLDAPFHPGLALMFVAQHLILYGMVQQFHRLPQRKW